MKDTFKIFALLAVVLFLGACKETSTPAPAPDVDNALLTKSTLPFEAPDFTKIKIEDYRPAFDQGMKEHMAEMETIANQKEAPTFENTIVAMEKSGELLNRVSSVFYNLTGSHSNDEIKKIEIEMGPKLSKHYDNILLNDKLYQRVKTLHDQLSDLDLDVPSEKLLKDTYLSFVRAGILLNEEEKTRIREINSELSEVSTKFRQSLLELTKAGSVLVDSEEKLSGLSADKIAAAKEAANAQGNTGKYLLTISNTTRVPLLKSLDNRAVRQQLWESSANRGLKGSSIDTRPFVKQQARLRAEKAELLGYANYATYIVEEQTAKTPENVMDLFSKMIPGLLANSEAEAALIEKEMQKDGLEGQVRPWDWEYYAEKVRKEKYNIDESVVRQYFELDKVLKDGVFFTMNKLLGLRFEERFDIPVYQEDVRVFDVFDENDEHIALFYADYFARPSKRGGAWMSSFVSQTSLLNKKPVIINVMNIPKPVKGEPALISFDNATTMFHEMGHAVHGLLSDVKYPSQAGTSVPRDFVEFPSTFQEDWAIEPEVLENYAVHYETGERIPQSLLNKLVEARGFNQGFDTQEYLAAALLDMEWHLLGSKQIPENVEEFEKEALAKHNLLVEAIPPRYRSQYFAHIFAGGYSASYYAYMWSEILAADAFAYMQENGGLLSENGKRFTEFILSKGGSEEAMKLYQQYRGEAPDVKHLLARRGLNVN